jgi:hypothetical protein
MSVACGEGGKIKAIVRAKHCVISPENRLFDKHIKLWWPLHAI